MMYKNTVITAFCAACAISALSYGEVDPASIQHRYMTPSMSVSTNAWLSVSGRVERAVSAATNGLATAADLATKADKGELEGFATTEDLLAFYYPDGDVTSMDQITTNGIEYAVGDGGAYVTSAGQLSGHVVLPWKVTIGGSDYKVTAIGEGAFMDKSVTGLTAPTTVKSIGNEAFHGCYSLASVNIPSATSIGGSAFSYCYSLKTVNIPSARSIGDYAFMYCGPLTSVNIPSVTSIGGSAFSYCYSLKTVDFGPSPKSAVPLLASPSFEGVSESCRFIIPIGMYDKWIAASGWSDLYAAEYRFEGYASTTQLDAKADKTAISATDPAFSNAVLAVGLNVDTNSVAVLNEIAATFGGFPIEGAATTVGGLLAALAAAIAFLKKNKADKAEVDALSAKVDAANTELEEVA